MLHPHILSALWEYPKCTRECVAVLIADVIFVTARRGRAWFGALRAWTPYMNCVHHRPVMDAYSALRRAADPRRNGERPAVSYSNMSGWVAAIWL